MRCFSFARTPPYSHSVVQSTLPDPYMFTTVCFSYLFYELVYPGMELRF